jgi:ribosome-binding factor A
MARKRSGSSASEGASQRQLRVGEELRHALTLILRQGGLRDPALQRANITVSEVRISPDLRNATAFVMPLGGANVEDVLAALQRSAGFIKRLIARQVPLRRAPNVVFALDRSFDEAGRINALLTSPAVKRDLVSSAAPASDDDAG